MLHSLRTLSSVLAILFLLAACTPVAPTTTLSGQEASLSGTPVEVVATTNFVADWARVVGGSRVEVFSLLPVGGDPHTFLPGARDVAKVADADLVLTVGLGLEADWLQDLLHNASADESRIVALGEGVDPIEFTMVDMHDDHADEDEHGHAEDEHEDEHGHAEDEHEDEHDHDEMIMGRLLVADAVESHLSVI
ncbi:MAG: zinc ABC transporter substrate-binding protein, partial [Caldilineaceae bacterium SB0668_bin_21]|nr:zinc ABC transporter substrate-binding protein [Caldilineaceae bacterium SB0668_bin_21]